MANTKLATVLETAPRFIRASAAPHISAYAERFSRTPFAPTSANSPWRWRAGAVRDRRPATRRR